MNLATTVLNRLNEKTGNKGSRLLAIHIGVDQYEAFNQTCKRMRLPMTSVVREMIALFLEQNKKKLGRPFGSTNKAKPQSNANVV